MAIKTFCKGAMLKNAIKFDWEVCLLIIFGALKWHWNPMNGPKTDSGSFLGTSKHLVTFLKYISGLKHPVEKQEVTKK